MAAGTRVLSSWSEALGAVAANEHFKSEVKRLEKISPRTPEQDAELEIMRNIVTENEMKAEGAWQPVTVGVLMLVAAGVGIATGLVTLTVAASLLLVFGALITIPAVMNMQENIAHTPKPEPDFIDLNNAPYSKIQKMNFTGKLDPNGKLNTIVVKAEFDLDKFQDAFVKPSNPTIIGARATALGGYETTQTVKNFGKGARETTTREILVDTLTAAPAPNQGKVHKTTVAMTYPVKVKLPVPPSLAAATPPLISGTPPKFTNSHVIEKDKKGRVSSVVELVFDPETNSTSKTTEIYSPSVPEDKLNGASPKKFIVEKTDYSFNPPRTKTMTETKDKIVVVEEGPDPSSPGDRLKVTILAENDKTKISIEDIASGLVIDKEVTRAEYNKVKEDNKTKVRASYTEVDSLSFWQKTEGVVDRVGIGTTVILLAMGAWLPAAVAAGLTYMGSGISRGTLNPIDVIPNVWGEAIGGHKTLKDSPTKTR